jgi:hypothetical protein
MQTVTRFEANLLRLLSFFLHREPAERVLPLFDQRFKLPPCLSRGAVHLVQDALAKGCVFLLAHRGGWRRERFLRGDRVVEGRLWERTPPVELGLKFSAHTLDFLQWITANRPGDKDGRWRPPEGSLTTGDRVVLYFAYQGLRQIAQKQGGSLPANEPPFTEHGLCWLAYPEDYAAAPARAKPNFAPWIDSSAAWVLEALQEELTARWIQVESSKERLAEPQVMRNLGQAQERVLNAFLDAVEQAGRLDLARFLLRAAVVLIGPHAHPGMWTAKLHLTGQRLADRAATYQAAATFLRRMDRLQELDRKARAVGYFDEGYAASQLWKADWEQAQGDDLVGRAQAIIRQLDPMRHT